MANLNTIDIIAEIEKALTDLACQEDAVVVTNVRSIVLTNLDRGRVQKFVDGDCNHVQAYVQKVTQGYKEFGQIVKSLQNDHSPIAWTDLLRK